MISFPSCLVSSVPGRPAAGNMTSLYCTVEPDNTTVFTRLNFLEQRPQCMDGGEEQEGEWTSASSRSRRCSSYARLLAASGHQFPCIQAHALRCTSDQKQRVTRAPEGAFPNIHKGKASLLVVLASLAHYTKNNISRPACMKGDRQQSDARQERALGLPRNSRHVYGEKWLRV